MEPANDSAARHAYRNRTWAELPPPQRRFFLWVVLAVVLIVPIVRGLLRVIGLSDSAAWILALALSLLVLVPLGLAALQEARERKKAGLEPPVFPVTSRALTAWIASALVLWILYAFLVVSQGFVLPLMPIFVSIVAVRRWLQRRSQSCPAARTE